MSHAIYRSVDGTSYFAFSYERHGNEVRIYIDLQPSYGDRATGAHETHRYTDGRRKYICFTGAIQTESDARAVAEAWAERTLTYIRTGQSF